jgi:hypothetical protein
LFIGKPSADKRESAIWAPHDPTGHAFVEGNVQVWTNVVNAEKTAVVVKRVLRQVEAVALATTAENLLASLLDGLVRLTGRFHA